jgi:hypothetical protein
MSKVNIPKLSANQNLKDLKPFEKGLKKSTESKLTQAAAEPAITENAKQLNAPKNATSNETPTNSESALEKAGNVAKDLAKVPALPIVVPVGSPSLEATKIESSKKTNDVVKKESPHHFIKKPAVIFIEGFSAFGISNGDGITEMAENYPGAKKFDWTEHDAILSEIKKHAPNQPVVLVGHSFGGDTAIEVANELNHIKNGFRTIDLLVSIDAVGMNKTIIPINVKNNLNFFGEGLIPFVHGDPTIARNTKYTDVTNELRSDMHSKMEDSPEVQFQIFEKINEVLGAKGEEDIFIEITEKKQIRDILDALKDNL